ncbi:MAG: aminoglycoside phosphotransferase family protein [Caldilineaceae bacterium]|nr:aminoglycoside phosphotransferase family protein [Caldilineaceae bacterium]
MILTAENILFYLLERGLVTMHSVVDGDLVVVESSSRNRNFKVIRRKQPGYFVKQVQQWDQASIDLVRREADCYQLVHQEAEFDALAALMPAFHGYDAASNTLVVGLLPDGENLSEYHRRLDVYPVDVAKMLGQALGALHAPLDQDSHPIQQRGLPGTVPWILSAHQLNQQPAHNAQGANQQVLSIIHKYTQFHPLLDQLRQQWRRETLIHGDVKWDNCLLYRRDEQLRLKLIDWETADWGDPAWDVGAIFQAYLVYWIMTIPIQPDTPPAHFLHLAPQPLEAVQPALITYWQAYQQQRGLASAAAQELLTRSAQYGAARMLQTAYEYMVYAPQISGNALCMLQVSLNILSQPEAAVHELFGL